MFDIFAKSFDSGDRTRGKGLNLVVESDVLLNQLFCLLKIGDIFEDIGEFGDEGFEGR